MGFPLVVGAMVNMNKFGVVAPDAVVVGCKVVVCGIVNAMVPAARFSNVDDADIVVITGDADADPTLTVSLTFVIASPL
jgi:hypothetical protein